MVDSKEKYKFDLGVKRLMLNKNVSRCQHQQLLLPLSLPVQSQGMTECSFSYFKKHLIDEGKKKKIETTKFKPFTVQKQFNQSKEKLNKSSKKEKKSAN